MKNWITFATLVLACLSCRGADLLPSEPPDGLDQSAALPTDPDEADDAQVHNLIDAAEAPAVEMPNTAAQKPYTLQLRLATRATYDDNIFIQEIKPVSDLISSVAPGLSLGMGDLRERKSGFVALSYDADAFFFASNPELNCVNQDASLLAHWTGARLTLDGRLTFRDTTDTNSEVNNRVREKFYEAGINASYDWSDKTTLGAALTGTVNDYEQLLSSHAVEFRLWADHQVTALTKLGLGTTLGQVDVSKGSTQIYEQLLARFNYAAASKVDLLLQVGGELRQIQGSSSVATPVVSLGASYSPYELIKVSLTGYRRVQPSVINSDANTVVSGVELGLTHQFLERYEASLDGAFEHSQYQSIASGVSEGRNDDYFRGKVGLAYSITDQIRLGSFYQYQFNASTQAGRGFADNQVSLELALTY